LNGILFAIGIYILNIYLFEEIRHGFRNDISIYDSRHHRFIYFHSRLFYGGLERLHRHQTEFSGEKMKPS